MDDENENGVGENNNYKPFYTIDSENCESLNMPGAGEHAEGRETPQGWIGPALLLCPSEVTEDLKRSLLNDSGVPLLGENPKRLCGDTITNVRATLFVMLENWKGLECASTREPDEETGLIK